MSRSPKHVHEPSFTQSAQAVPFCKHHSLDQHDSFGVAPMQTLKLAVPTETLSNTTLGRNKSAGISRWRLACVGLVFLMLFGLIGWRLIYLAWTYRDTENPAIQGNLRIPVASKPDRRAQILDRNGELLAANLDVNSVFVDPRDVINVERTVQTLSSVLTKKDPEWIHSQVTSNNHFRWLDRNLTPNQEQEIRRLGLPGIRFKPESRRFYPKGDLVSHIIGYTGLDNDGLSGFEYSFDTLLQNSSEPLRLSLDVRAQHIIAEELQDAMDDFNALQGVGILMDVNSSEIIAMVSLPTFNPYSLETANNDQMFNRATQGVYELGSIFKVFTVGMAMELQGIRPTDIYKVGDPLTIGKWEIGDFHDYGDTLTVAEVLTNSSNKGTAQIALEVGGNAQRSFLRKLGLLKEPQFELTQVGRPGYPSNWGKIQTATVSYGHGISVSPLQTINAFNSMVNGGIYREPTLMRSDNGYRPGRPIIAPEVSYDLNTMLRLVVTKGTGKNADAQGYRVGGKTGTADRQTVGGYDENRRIASFIGAFPIDNPQYSLLVVIYDPEPNEQSYGYATGGWVAAPASKRIVERLGPILGVVPEGIYPEIISNH